MKSFVPLAAAVVLVTGCLLPDAARKRSSAQRFESAHYSQMRGKIGFAKTRIPGAASRSPTGVSFIDVTDLSAPLHLRAYLPEAYGNRFERACQKTWIAEWGNYGHSAFVSVRVGDDSEEVLLDLDDVTSSYVNEVVEVSTKTAKFFSPKGKLSFPFSARAAPYRFALHVVPKLEPGANQLHFTAGIRCMSDPSNAVAVTGTLTLNATEQALAALPQEVGPFLEAAAHSSLRGQIPGMMAQFAQLLPEYEALLIEPLDRGWTIRKNALDIPIDRSFYAVIVAREESTGRCFGNEGIVTSEYSGTDYTAPELRIRTRVWVPFPCDRVNERTRYVRPDVR